MCIPREKHGGIDMDWKLARFFPCFAICIFKSETDASNDMPHDTTCIPGSIE